MKIYLILITFSIYLSASYINNFNQKVFVKKDGEYYITKNSKKLKISNRVIVKSKLNKKELQKIYENIYIQKIAELKDSSLFLFHLKNKDSIEFSKKIMKNKNIIYAQPDILQINEKSKKEAETFFDLNLTKLHNYSKGKGVNIAIIDDGFDLSNLKDVSLIFSYDVDTKTLTSTPKIELDTHGTQVAEVIFKVAPEANLIAIRQTSSYTSDNILAFYVAKLAGANVINCSWRLQILFEPIKDMIDSLDTTTLFSAGNNSCDISKCNEIATLESVFSIGAINRKDKLMKYSNYGQGMDFVTYTNFKVLFQNKYKNFGGTSASNAFASGVVALILAINPNLTKKDIFTILNSSATNLNSYKKLEPLKALKLTKSYKGGLNE